MRHPPGDHLLVAAQLAGVALAVVPAPGRGQGSVYWLVIAAAGMALGIATLCYNRIGNFSIYPRPRNGARLIVDGPYRLVRHPMYLALVLMMVAIAGYNGTLRHGLGALLVAGAVLAKARIEERWLLRRFESYPGYCRRTRRFLPYLY